jgi:hypothetical protein
MDHGISYEAILVAFADDDSISDNCDPDNEDKTPTGVALDVYKKLNDWQSMVDGTFKEFKQDGEIVGFAYYYGNILVSFGINKKHRKKETLISFFENIKQWLGGNFITFMWKRNERAISWFKRCGMEQEDINEDGFVKLKYESCH